MPFKSLFLQTRIHSKIQSLLPILNWYYPNWQLTDCGIKRNSNLKYRETQGIFLWTSISIICLSKAKLNQTYLPDGIIPLRQLNFVLSEMISIFGSSKTRNRKIQVKLRLPLLPREDLGSTMRWFLCFFRSWRTASFTNPFYVFNHLFKLHIWQTEPSFPMFCLLQVNIDLCMCGPIDDHRQITILLSCIRETPSLTTREGKVYSTKNLGETTSQETSFSSKHILQETVILFEFTLILMQVCHLIWLILISRYC